MNEHPIGHREIFATWRKAATVLSRNYPAGGGAPLPIALSQSSRNIRAKEGDRCLETQAGQLKRP
ncbi:MAG: hypothetical protein JWO80_2891 [Bryobacterales bacterium]|nr:hypothetical protein [Bryobacterales bacterium]